jgi:digeranylgeranylglycerophospholipid reductase
MDKLDTDILIVGAGPAGSAAALAACQRGVKTLMIERKETIGLPVQCAEFIPARLFGDLELDSSICVQKITGMQTYICGKLENQVDAPGYMINRWQLDQYQAEEARSKGCDILTSTRARGFQGPNTVILQSRDKQIIHVTTKVIIAADGPQSDFRKWMSSPRPTLLPGVQKVFQLRKPSSFTKVYFKPEFFGGYGWIFPKNDCANVGLGLRNQLGNSRSACQLLTEFVSELQEADLIYGEPLASTAGWIPVEPMQQAVWGNVLFVGDAAGQTHPITGAGIFSALTCGEMAGKWAAFAIQSRNFDLLKEYDKEWWDLFGRSLSHAASRRRLMETEWHQFDRIIKSCWVAFKEYHV